MFRSESRYRVHVCLGPNCLAQGSRRLLAHLETELAARTLTAEIEVIATSCRDRCEYAPSANVYPGPTFYNGFTERDLDEIVSEHLISDRPVERLRYKGDFKGR